MNSFGILFHYYIDKATASKRTAYIFRLVPEVCDGVFITGFTLFPGDIIAIHSDAPYDALSFDALR